MMHFYTLEKTVYLTRRLATLSTECHNGIQASRPFRAGARRHVRRFYRRRARVRVARLHGKAYATSNYCTHLDCLLSAGKLVDDGIGCSCHGSVFDLDTGEPIYPPATEPIKTYPVEEGDGEIFVGVDPMTLQARPPPAGRPES